MKIQQLFRQIIKEGMSAPFKGMMIIYANVLV